ncbi:MAG: phage protein Gp27 family protein [Aeromonas veronii]
MTAEEGHELAVLVNEIGVKQVLELLRAHRQQNTPFTMVSKPRRTVQKYMKWPPDIRATFAYMICSGEYTQVEMMNYINEELEKRGLADEMKVSRTALHRFVKNIESSAASD